MARPIKVRDKQTGEIIEFNWDDPSPPTPFDIDRIVNERKSKPINIPEPAPTDSLISTPRFPNRPSSLSPFDNIPEEPTFRTQVFGDYLLPEPFPKRTFDEPPSFKSELKRGWNAATTPLMPDVEEGLFGAIDKYDPTGFARPITEFIGGGATSPLGLATLGLGSFAALKGTKALKKGGELINKWRGVGTEIEPIADDIARVGAADITGTPTTTRVPRYKIQDIEGKRTIIPEPNVAANAPFTAELADELGKVPVQANLTAQLPPDLRGAKPRYQSGVNSYEPRFESDIDKALYIIANRKKPSARDADYAKFIMDNTGMSADEVQKVAEQVKAGVGNVLKNHPLNKPANIPRLYNPQDIAPITPLEVAPNPLFNDTIQPGPRNPVTGKIDPIDATPNTLPDLNPTMVSKEGQEIAGELRRTMSDKTGKTTAVLTGDEVTPQPSQAKIAAEKQTSAVPPSAQAEQSINEFVPKDINEALEMLDAAEKKLKVAGKDEKFIDHFKTQFWNFPKASWATLDLSAPLRQGKGLIYRGEYWRAFDDMAKSFMSEQGYVETMAKIKLKPTYALMKKYDPGIIDLEKSGKGLLKMEENRMSDWAENIPSLGSMFKALKERDVKYARTYVFQPEGVGAGKEALGKTSLLSRGVRASDRAYSGFLNTLRADTFENMVYSFEKSGMNPYNDPELLKATADFISTATGRASLGSFEAAAHTLNKYSFSVRFAKSRLDMGVLAPVKWRNAPLEIQNEVAKSFLGQAIYTSTFLTLAHGAGAEVGLDPTSTDFGKIKVGDTRIDTLAGLQQPMVAVTRILSQLSTSPTTGKTEELGVGYRPKTGIDVATDFTRTKLSPWTGLGWDLAKKRTISGNITTEEMQRIDQDNYFVKMLAPNLISTLSDLAQSDPQYLAQLGIPLSRFLTSDGKPIPIPVVISSLGIVGLSALGESVQTFDEPAPQSKRKKSLSSFSYSPKAR
jgi:hypothetical protein